MTGKEYKLAIKIAGVVDRSFDTSLTAADTKLKRFQNLTNQLDGDFSRLDKGFDKIMGIGQKCFSVIAAAAGAAVTAVGAVTAASVTVGSEFESAFTEVKKTVDATEQEYARLRADILEMTRTIPEEAAEVAAVMEVAGQLGIATDSLTDFTKTIINLGMSTNLSAEEGAAALAKFANIVGMADYDEKGISNWERLGSVIVDLGNNFATTEADIVNMSTRLASTGNLVGLSEAQILALSTAMSSVGIESEVGGSTMSKLLKKMQLAVELAPKSQKELDDMDDLAGIKGFASVSNTTVDEFQQIFKEDAVAALALFIDGLDDVERNGKSAIAIMDEMDLDEIRLSNTIMALANADGVMSAAVQTARDAWEENTALVEEAGKRYETAESKVQIMKNAVKEMGITAYDSLREPFVGTVEAITEKVQAFNDYIGRADGLGKWLQDAQTQFPTFQRKFKKFAQPAFSGIEGAGKWIVKHGKGIISTLAGIGAALAAYKAASTITHTINAIMSLGSLNPATLGVLGAASAVGLLAGALTEYKQRERDLINHNLADHFGSIALSMEELEEVARHILADENIGLLDAAGKAFDGLEEIAASIEDNVSTLNKMNWKVSIGMDLTQDEMGEYRDEIESFISNCQGYALQQQYAVTLSVRALISDDSLETTNVVDTINRFYADKQGELSRLGSELSAVITDAFADGLFEVNEMEQVIKIQQQMAKIQSALADSEFDAALTTFGYQYNGAELTPDTFRNLLDKLQEQGAESAGKYEEALKAAMQQAELMKKEGYFENDTVYREYTDGLYAGYLDNVSRLNARILQFATDTVKESGLVDDAVGEAWGKISAAMNPAKLSHYADNYGSDWVIAFRNELLDMYDLREIDELLYESLWGDMGLMPGITSQKDVLEKYAEEYRKMGREIPQWITEGISDYELLGSFGGGLTEYLMGLKLAMEPELSEFAEKAMKEGVDVPRLVAAGIESAESEVADAVIGMYEAGLGNTAREGILPVIESLYAWSQEAMDEYFSKEFQVTADVRIALNPALLFTTYADYLLGVGKRFYPDIDENADGGIIRNRELSWLAEKGPEAVIPLDGSRNAVALWEKTGRLLGMESALDGLDLNGGGSTITIEYHPTLKFYGEAPSKEDLTEALDISQDKFDSMMERYLKTRSRTAFG